MHIARGYEYGVRHILSPRSGDLGEIIAETTDLPLSAVLDLLTLGAVYYQHKRVFESFEIKNQDYIRVHSKPRRFPKDDKNWKARTVFENEHFLVLNKPAGIPVHASVDNVQENLVQYLSTYLNQQVYITHRLDLPTQGLIVFAKTLEFQTAFNKLLIERQVSKIYRARVEGLCFETGLIRHFMEPSPRAPKTLSARIIDGDASPDLKIQKWQECVLEILSTETSTELYDKLYSELRIRLHTGRTHQIRAQMSALGHPLIGDTMYGAHKLPDKNSETNFIELQACEIQFTCPISGKPYHFKL